MDALLITDFQNDFTPGGALAVEGGDEIGEPINRARATTSTSSSPRATGIRPTTARSSASRSTRTSGKAPIRRDLAGPLRRRHARAPSFTRASTGARSTSCSTRDRARTARATPSFHGSGLADALRERGVDRLYVTGLTTDYCVKNSVLDALREGFEVIVVEDAIRAVNVNHGDGERALEEMRERGRGRRDLASDVLEPRSEPLDAVADLDLAGERAVHRALAGDHAQPLELLVGQRLRAP